MDVGEFIVPVPYVKQVKVLSSNVFFLRVVYLKVILIFACYKPILFLCNSFAIEIYHKAVAYRNSFFQM